MPFDSLYRLLSIRPDETRSVGLFFLHHFFLGFGTMLVYVSANVILLENRPEVSLPYAYMASALGMMLVGKLYSYWEHHWPLRTLVSRVIGSVLVLTAILVAWVIYGHSVTAAVIIMVGFRLIYLLTNLEFWGLSALMFDVRQSKRLFGVISAGDMPAKALGGLLAVLIHHHSEVVFLLVLAFVFFGAAMYTARVTLQTQALQPSHTSARLPSRKTPSFVAQLFGGSELLFAMCLSTAAIAVMATGIEYAFFINVKYKLHSQADVMAYLGGVLTLTYLLATFVKVIVSRKTIERFGLNRALALLPLSGLASVALLSFVFYKEYANQAQLIAYCGVYLVFEVVRRALFDPVFLVLFQPLSTQQRLHGHTLVKGFYEPLGLGIGGLMLYASQSTGQNGPWFLVEELVIAALLALWFLRKTYRHYVHTLQNALSRRFVVAEDLAIPQEAVEAILRNLHSDKPREVINAIEWLVSHKSQGLVSSPRLQQSILSLLPHPDPTVRWSALKAVKSLGLLLPIHQLHQTLWHDPHEPAREVAAWLLTQQNTQKGIELLYNEDITARKGAISSLLNQDPAHPVALKALSAMTDNPQPKSQLAALQLIGDLKAKSFEPAVVKALKVAEISVVEAAIKAAGILQTPNLTAHLTQLLAEKKHWRAAAHSLAQLQDEAVAALPVADAQNLVLQRRIVQVAGQIQTEKSYQWLTQVAHQSEVSVRTLALRALRNFPPNFRTVGGFESLLEEELNIAQFVLHAQVQPLDDDLKNSLNYEQEAVIERIFGILMQLYDQEAIANTHLSIQHSSRERRANSLELLENTVSRQVYGCLHALLDPLPVTQKIRLIDAQLGLWTPTASVSDIILKRGTRFFTDWTLRLTLRGVSPETLFQHSQLQLMSHTLTPANVSITERVMVLKNTHLFAETPENVLSSIAPIMREVGFDEGQVIFEKGDLGSSMFVIYEGEVSIYDGATRLATFVRGDVFGELALLDAEPRSATAVVTADTQLFRIDQNDFYDLMDERGEVMRNIIKMLCQRIRQQNAKLVAKQNS